MNLKHQTLAAVASTAVLMTAAVAVLVGGGGNSSFAMPISPEVQEALKQAVSHPNSELQTVLQQMDAAKPGSAAAFVQAIQNTTDTDALAGALAKVAEANGALNQTLASAISTALSDLRTDQRVASTAGDSVGQVVNTVQTAVNGTFSQAISSGMPVTGAPTLANGSQPQGQNTQTANNLPALNPTAPGPLAGPGNPFASPFTMPGHSLALTPVNLPGPPTVIPPPIAAGNPPGPPVTAPGNPHGPGKPNSRS